MIIPAWNASATLERAVRSALQQNGVSVEVIVVDDASEDETLACAKKLASGDRRVRVLCQKTNKGPAAARNFALEHAQAPYVTPLDADDFMEQGRLLALLTIAKEGSWDFVADDLYRVSEIDPNGKRQRLISEKQIGLRRLDFASFVEGNLSSQRGGRRELGFIKPLISRDFLKKHDLRYEETIRLGEDYILYATALLRHARFCIVDPTGYIAVMRPSSLSGQHTTRDIGALVQGDLALMAEANLTHTDREALRAHYIETLKKWHWLRLIDAVKSRNLSGSLRCFWAPLPVVRELFENLAQQAVLRSYAKAKILFREASGRQISGKDGGKK